MRKEGKKEEKERKKERKRLVVFYEKCHSAARMRINMLKPPQSLSSSGLKPSLFYGGGGGICLGTSSIHVIGGPGLREEKPEVRNHIHGHIETVKYSSVLWQI